MPSSTTGVPQVLSEANILGGVFGSEVGNDASEDDGERTGSEIEDEELDFPVEEFAVLKEWSFSQGHPCNSCT